MDIAVSGASGLIGTALTASLVNDGHRVRRLVRDGAAGADVVHWAPITGTIDAAALEGVDAVVHLAGEGIGNRRWTDGQKQRMLESRTRGTGLLARTVATLQQPPRAFVSASAIGYYGNRGDELLTEASSGGSGFLADICRQWEASTARATDAGIRVAHLRTGIVLDPHGGVLARLLLPFRLGLGGRVSTGRQYMSWISLRDEVRAIRFVLGQELEGAVNLTAPNPVTNAEFTRTLGHALHRPTVVPTPLFALKARYGAELVRTLVVEGQRVRPAALTAAGFDFADPELAGALPSVLDG